MSGIIGALVMGVIGDKTKQLSSIIKFAFLFVTSGYIGLLCVSLIFLTVQIFILKTRLDTKRIGNIVWVVVNT